MNLFFDFSLLTFDFLLLVTFPNPDKVGRQRQKLLWALGN